MNRYTLESYLENHSQNSLAEAVGISQGAVSKMLRTGRNITVVELSSGQIQLIEERPIGNRRPSVQQSVG